MQKPLKNNGKLVDFLWVLLEIRWVNLEAVIRYKVRLYIELIILKNKAN